MSETSVKLVWQMFFKDGIPFDEIVRKTKLNPKYVRDVIATGIGGVKARWLNRKEIIEKMRREGKTLVEVASHYGVNVATVSRACKRYGFRSERITPASRWEKRRETIRFYLDEGKSLRYIGELFKVTRERMRQVCNALGIIYKKNKRRTKCIRKGGRE